jgi:hypothetical protein
MKRLKKEVWETKKKYLEDLKFTKREVELIKIAIYEGINIRPYEVEEIEDGAW